MEPHVIKDQYALTSHKKAMLLWSRYVEEGKFQKIENLATKDCIQHMPDGEDIIGIEKIIKLEKEICMAFPDMKFEVKSQVAEGDEACTRGVITGTHRGIYNGMAPSNKKVKIPMMWMCKFTPEGKIKEAWDEFDNATLMNQITRH